MKLPPYSFSITLNGAPLDEPRKTKLATRLLEEEWPSPNKIIILRNGNEIQVDFFEVISFLDQMRERIGQRGFSEKAFLGGGRIHLGHNKVRESKKCQTRNGVTIEWGVNSKDQGQGHYPDRPEDPELINLIFEQINILLRNALSKTN